ncbi:MAG: helix-turn-helix domain-containing protein [Cyclobacteriaceae bacterium]
MTLSQPPVHPALKPFIKSYHLIELEAISGFTQMVPASTRCVLNIPCGNEVCIRLKNKQFTSSEPFLLGLTTQSYSFASSTSQLKSFSVEFTDTGFHALFREDSQVFTDRCALVEDTGNQGLSVLSSLLAEAKTASEKITVVERYLLPYLPPDLDVKGIQRMQAAIHLIRQHCGNINTVRLAEEACLSERQFRRLFAEFKGCSPKYFSRLVRFTHLFTEVMQQQAEVSWVGLAYKYHFHDQMHLIKDFKHFSLHTPSHFPLQQFLLSSSLSFPVPENKKSSCKRKINF